MSDINIAMASSQEWLKYTYVSIASILEHANDSDNYHFYIISCKFTQKDKNNFYALNSIKPAKYTFCITDNSSYDEFYISTRYGYATNYRLNLPQFVDADKVIYLDLDTLIMSDIAELYNIDVDGYYMGAIIDKCSKIMKSRVTDDNDYIFVNAGVLLINLKAFRENDLMNRMRDYMITHKKFCHNDQDAINSVCYQKIKYLPLKFNVAVGTPFVQYNPDEYDKALEQPVILHYAIKPWESKSSEQCFVMWHEKYHQVKLLQKNFEAKQNL